MPAPISRGPDRALLIVWKFSPGFCIRKSFPSSCPAGRTIRVWSALDEPARRALVGQRSEFCVNHCDLWMNFAHANQRDELDDGGRIPQAGRSGSPAAGEHRTTRLPELE